MSSIGELSRSNGSSLLSLARYAKHSNVIFSASRAQNESACLNDRHAAGRSCLKIRLKLNTKVPTRRAPNPNATRCKMEFRTTVELKERPTRTPALHTRNYTIRHCQLHVVVTRGRSRLQLRSRSKGNCSTWFLSFTHTYPDAPTHVAA